MKELFHQETLLGTFFGFVFSVPLRASLRGRSSTYKTAATIGMVVGLSFVGSLIHDYRTERHRLKQLFLEDYIDKYPEDFPQFKKRKLLKDKIEYWGISRV